MNNNYYLKYIVLYNKSVTGTSVNEIPNISYINRVTPFGENVSAKHFDCKNKVIFSNRVNDDDADVPNIR